MLKSTNTDKLVDELIDRTSSMLAMLVETEPKTVHKDEEGDQ